jgi:hypothetical protein
VSGTQIVTTPPIGCYNSREAQHRQLPMSRPRPPIAEMKRAEINIMGHADSAERRSSVSADTGEGATFTELEDRLVSLAVRER